MSFNKHPQQAYLLNYSSVRAICRHTSRYKFVTYEWHMGCLRFGKDDIGEKIYGFVNNDTRTTFIKNTYKCGNSVAYQQLFNFFLINLDTAANNIVRYRLAKD